MACALLRTLWAPHMWSYAANICVVGGGNIFVVVVVVVAVVLYYIGGAQAWTRQVPWYVPCGGAMCVLRHDFAPCVYV